jgi:hypothetical protein
LADAATIRKVTENAKNTYLIGVNKPLNCSCLKYSVAIWDNHFVQGAKVVAKDGLLCLEGAVQRSFLALLGVFR